MSTNALGLIEVVGMTSAVEAADSAVKSANVSLIGYELTKGDGLIVVKFEGDVGAVKAGLDSAKAAVLKMGGEVYSILAIPRPADGLDKIVRTKDTVGHKSDSKKESKAEHKEEAKTEAKAEAKEEAKLEVKEEPQKEEPKNEQKETPAKADLEAPPAKEDKKEDYNNSKHNEGDNKNNHKDEADKKKKHAGK